MPRVLHSVPIGTLRARTPLVLPGQRIGIMGGSFNPPHEGHSRVAETALKRLGLDQLWWVVTPGNPLKGHGALAPLAARMTACRALAKGPRMFVTSFEQELGTPYTAATLAFLRARYPAATFVWVMGADNLATFHRWQDWRAIARHHPIAVVDRPGWRLRSVASRAAQALKRSRLPEDRAGTLARPGTKPRWALLSTRLSKESSTRIREARAQ